MHVYQMYKFFPQMCFLVLRKNCGILLLFVFIVKAEAWNNSYVNISVLFQDWEWKKIEKEYEKNIS